MNFTECWEKREQAAADFQHPTAGGTYFKAKYRAIIEFNGQQVPCWIGPKNIDPRFSGVLLILEDSQDLPDRKGKYDAIAEEHKVNGTKYKFYHFHNNPKPTEEHPEPNDGYNEMRSYFLGKGGKGMNVIVLKSLQDIGAGTIVTELNKIFPCSE